MGPVEGLISERSGGIDHASSFVQARAALEGVLVDIGHLSASMVRGQCVGSADVDRARRGLSDLAERAFEKLLTTDREAAREWLGELPAHLRRGVPDMSKWRARLGLPESREAFRAEKEAARRAWAGRRVAEASAALGADADPLELIEAVFSVALPKPLRAVWSSALRGEPGLFLGAGPKEVLDAAEVVWREVEGVAAGPFRAAPYRFVPFADGRDEERGASYFVLDLASPSDQGDFTVLEYGHDRTDLTRVGSSATWLEWYQVVHPLVRVVRDAMGDPAAYDMLSELAESGDDEALLAWCRERWSEEGLSPGADAATRAFEEAFEGF